MIRYHSFYPWHRENAYTHFMNADDEAQLRAVRAFNRESSPKSLIQLCSPLIMPFSVRPLLEKRRAAKS